MEVNEGSLEVKSLTEAVGKTVNGYPVIAIDEEKKQITLLVDGEEMIIKLVELKHNQNLVCKYQGNHQIKIALSDDGLYKIGVDKYEITLNGEMHEDALRDSLIILDNMIAGLDKIKINVFANTRKQTEMEANMENELIEQGNVITQIVVKNIQKLRHKRTSLMVLNGVTVRITQLEEIIANLNESIAMYSDEDNEIEPEIIEIYNQFIMKLKKLREVTTQINNSLKNKLGSVKNIMKLYGIKE